MDGVVAPSGQTPKRYKSPPVVEAICEVFLPGSLWSDGMTSQFEEEIKDRFPKKTFRGNLGYAIPVWPGLPDTPVLAPAPRVMFQTLDESIGVQIGANIVVVNRLPPYKHFAEWSPLVVEMVERYRRLASSKGPTLVALRYLNRITLPTTNTERGPALLMEDYFCVYPELPKHVGGHGPFLLRIILKPSYPNHNLVVTLNSAPPQVVDHTHMNFLLDIYDLPMVQTDITKGLEEAHANVNYGFEMSITEKTRALFGVQ
jgi:uncharacterized protein (TIGR04255 family)